MSFNPNYINNIHLTFARCESTDYEKMGFSQYHYRERFNHAAHSFKFYVDGEPCGFVAMLAQPFGGKGGHDSWRVSRVVVLPQYQRMGLGSLMEVFIAALYTHHGKTVYASCQSKHLGKKHELYTHLWKEGSGNRKASNGIDNKYRNRITDKCFRHRYIGADLANDGIEEVLSPITYARAHGIIGKQFEVDLPLLLKVTFPYITDFCYMVDFWNLNLNELRERYDCHYPLFNHSPLPTVDEDTPYIVLPTDYIEIQRCYMKDKVSGERVPYRTENREKAKKLLYLNGLIRKKMNPSMGFEYLLHCLVRENEIGVEDGVVDKRTILGIATHAYLNDSTDFKPRENTKRFVVNPVYCAKHNLSMKSVANMANKELDYAEIDKWFDRSLSDKENMELLAKHNIFISLKTIQRYRQSRGILRYDKSKEESETTKNEKVTQKDKKPILAPKHDPYLFPLEWRLADLLKIALANGTRGKVFSCFGAPAGSSLGYMLGGYDVVGFNDSDPKISAIYVKNLNPKYPFITDIRKFKTMELPLELYDLDILDGSFPCDLFSICGVRDKSWGVKKRYKEGGIEQTLDDLCFELADVVGKLKPKVMVAENVAEFARGEAKNRYYNPFVAKLNSFGYQVKSFIVNFKHMGVPQSRKRLIIIAVREDIANLVNLDSLTMVFNEKPIPMKKIADYQGRTITAPKKLEVWEHRTLKDKGFGKINLRIKGVHKDFNCKIVKPTDICPTITTSGKNALIHYGTAQHFSDTELIKASTYPLDYDFCGKVGYIVGMSVPPYAMAHISHRIWEGILSKVQHLNLNINKAS